MTQVAPTFQPSALRTARTLRALTQQHVADQIGRSRQAIAKWEQGLSAPDADDLAKLATVLGVDIPAFYVEAAA